MNFAINDRPFDPENSNHILGAKTLFHETRCKGAAYYVFDFDYHPHDPTVVQMLFILITQYL